MMKKNIAFIECKWQNRVNKESELIEKAKDLTDGKRAYCLIATKDDYLNDNPLKKRGGSFS